jgi:acetyl esterase
MALDPGARALIERLDALGNPPYETLTPHEARRVYLERVPDLSGVAEPVARVDERVIPGRHGDVAVRVYRPSGDPVLPATVYFHGGGWVLGTLDTVDTPLRALANRAGCAVVSVDYPLAPEHRFPVTAEEAFAAVSWVAQNASELGVDHTRVAVAGDSAGGNLATVAALLARDRGGPRLACQVLVYPVTDFRFDTASYSEYARGYLLTRDTMRWFWQQYVATEDDGAHPCASPLRAPDLAGLPPALVVTAECDPLRDEGEAYAQRLREAGVAVTLSRYDGMVHGFFRMAGELEAGRRVIEECAAALRAALRG